MRTIIISNNAQIALEKLFIFLMEKWSLKVKNDFIQKLDSNIIRIAKHPEQFPVSKLKSGLRKCVITKQTYLFYTFDDDSIYILAVFDNRQNPDVFLKK